MTQREKVYAAIDRERTYQADLNIQRPHQSPRKYADIIQYYAWMPNGISDAEVMERILRIAAVAVCALEDNGLVEPR